MYRLSVPVMLTSPHFEPQRILEDLEQQGAERILLALPPLSTDETVQNRIFEKLAGAISFFKENGLETGVWFWTFWVEGKNDFTPITGFGGRKSANEKCPLDPNFLDFAASVIRKIAAMNPDIILYDDDFRLGNLDSGTGCLCAYHRVEMKKRLGTLPEGDLFQVMFSGKPNAVRDAYLDAAGESLKNFCRKMREAVDSVNPDIRLGACSCMSVWDTDGVDSFTLAGLFAGNTRPLVRLIGAPYWAENRFFGNRLEDVIELERMERGWYDGNDIEIFSEGDSYPRPRYRVPASYLEIFDTALRADGSFDGILKYMLDYTSSEDYERGYLEKHADSSLFTAEIDRIFGEKDAVGIRVYAALHKLRDTDFTGRNATVSTIDNAFFPLESRALAQNSIPTVYKGTGCAGIAFGENARHLPDSAYAKPLILDMAAARILTELGKDVGLAGVGESCQAYGWHFPAFADETVNLYSSGAFVCPVTLKENAVVHSQFDIPDGSRIPACFTYTNGDGERFIVITFEADRAPEAVMRNYMLPRQIAQLLKAFDSALPVECFGNPDLYILCKTDEKQMAIGLWNCHADYASGVRIKLEAPYKKAQFIGCSGRLERGVLVVDRIGAYEYGFVLLK